MGSPTTRPDPAPVPPAADPQAIRSCLTPTLAAEFDREWEIVLESMGLSDLHAWLNKWRHMAHMEMRDPGAYYRMLAKAEQILRTGSNADAVPYEEMQALIHQRQAR